MAVCTIRADPRVLPNSGRCARRAGIDGGIGATKDFPQSEGRPLTLMTIPVADVDDIIGKVERNGGRVVEPKRAIPGIGWFCTCAEPGGLLFGVLQPDPSAT